MAIDEIRETIAANCVTVLEAARMLDCSEQVVGRLIKDGKLEVVLGGGIRGNVRLLLKEDVRKLKAIRENATANSSS